MQRQVAIEVKSKKRDAALASPQPFLRQACPTSAGPGYQLVFWADAQIAEVVSADRGGCGDLFLRGGDLRQGNQDFWSLLDQAIASAPHVKQPDHLEIVRYQGNTQAPLYAKISLAGQAQRLFTDLSAFLSPAPSYTGSCENQDALYDDLFFYEGDILLRAQVFRAECSQVRIAGNMGSLALTPQFQQQLDQELARVTFTPVRPDTLEIEHAPTSIQSGSGPDFRTVTDQSAIQKLYHTTSSLLPWPSNKDSSCNSQGADGSYDVLTFSQGGAWLVSATAFSQCPTISFNRAGIQGGDASQATQEFWNQVHQIEKG